MRNLPMSRASVPPRRKTSRLEEVYEHKGFSVELKPENPWSDVLKPVYVIRILRNEVVNIIYHFECSLEAPVKSTSRSNFDVASTTRLIGGTFGNLTTWDLLLDIQTTRSEQPFVYC